MKLTRDWVRMRYVAPVSVAAMVLTGCAHNDGGLATGGALVACSDHVFWGTVQGTNRTTDGLHVNFRVEEWIKPASGDDSITLLADDPAENVGAPEWNTSNRILVLDEKDSPLTMMEGKSAEDLVSGWKQTAPLACPANY